jgi:hypothetical protein
MNNNTNSRTKLRTTTPVATRQVISGHMIRSFAATDALVEQYEPILAMAMAMD